MASVAGWYIFKPKIPMDIFWRAFESKCCHALWHFGIFFGHLAYFVVMWYIFPSFSMLYQEKSGNPGYVINTFVVYIGSQGSKITMYIPFSFPPPPAFSNYSFSSNQLVDRNERVAP
jgi:hypothetical protein